LGVRLSHQDLSCMVACTREAVSKAMGGFREAGLIETPGLCRLVVLDEPTLRELATGRRRRPGGPEGSTGVLGNGRARGYRVVPWSRSTGCA
jgi:hypothetical protein